MLQHKDVRSRLIMYLSKKYKASEVINFTLEHTKTEVAEIIGVAIPSVSRELKHMADDQLISISGNMITILKPKMFKL